MRDLASQVFTNEVSLQSFFLGLAYNVASVDEAGRQLGLDAGNGSCEAAMREVIGDGWNRYVCHTETVSRYSSRGRVAPRPFHFIAENSG